MNLNNVQTNVVESLYFLSYWKLYGYENYWEGFTPPQYVQKYCVIQPKG